MLFSRSPKIHRHQQVNQDGVDDADKVLAGVEFSVQYMGSIEVATSTGTGSGNTDLPVSQVMAQNKAKTGEKKKMTMTVTHKSLTVKEQLTEKLIASFPISKVTYCNVDSSNVKAFVFVARERQEKPFKAYVFLSESKTKAQEMFKTLSIAFKLNYESFQATAIREATLRSYARNELDDCYDENFNIDFNGKSVSPSNNTPAVLVQGKAVHSLEDCRKRSMTDPTSNNLKEDFSADDFDEFTQLAKSRSKTVCTQK